MAGRLIIGLVSWIMYIWQKRTATEIKLTWDLTYNLNIFYWPWNKSKVGRDDVNVYVTNNVIMKFK